MVIFYTSDYYSSDLKRRRELRAVMNTNLQLHFFDYIIVLFENYDQHQNKEELQYLKKTNIIIVNMTQRQSYKDIFSHAKENYPNEIIVISNSDIQFDKTITRISELDFNKKQAYAITRLQRVNWSVFSPPSQGYIDMNWSFDTYIFKGDIDVNLDTLDIQVGIGGCDTYLVKKLIIDNNIRVENVNFDIRTWHIDYKFEKDTNDRSYAHLENYNTRLDYPGGSNNYPFAITPFGGQIGLVMKNTDSYIITKSPFTVVKKLKVISFSLWGTEKRYLIGALRNAELALDLYPDWKCFFYVDMKTTPHDIVKKLKEFPNVHIIVIEKTYLRMSARFLAIDNPHVDIMICRDCDSRISIREVEAVNDWLRSGKTLHIMRDHPHHEKIFMGGMFGLKKCSYLTKKWDKIIESYKQHEGIWGLDIIILEKELYPPCYKMNDIKVHASFHNHESFAEDFPSDFNSDFNFVGEYINEDEIRGDHFKLIASARANLSTSSL